MKDFESVCFHILQWSVMETHQPLCPMLLIFQFVVSEILACQIHIGLYLT